MEIYNSLRCRRNSVIDPYSIDKNVLTNRGLWLSSQAQQAHMYMSSIRYVVIIFRILEKHVTLAKTL
ncbi:9774_t:CDS:2 [Rhizophagus irregularis]|uniref:Uncharacterized protein n=1 Tax=Rhizophagus irregularis (strain DAOM 181602 / DAOM 197198 / MUCL 43194) TaxID=747089 RepID=U9TE47_RHIID|nr:9774_t:CDS:2 [Rhizophagus irregularis]